MLSNHSTAHAPGMIPARRRAEGFELQDLAGKVAVVTGGASGIGQALVRAFLAEGMKVAIGDVEQSALDATVAELDGEVLPFVCDVSSPDSVAAFADAVYDRFGACHLLCNNAGVGTPNLNCWETEPNDWKWVHGVNVQGVTNGVQAFVPRMIAGGEEGLVMNTSSGDGGIHPLADQAIYASSKAAVSIITECLHAQLTGRGTKLRAAIFYPSGGVLNTGIWTTARNRPDDLPRSQPAPEGSEVTFDQFMDMMKTVGVDIQVQDLDELARFAVGGIKAGDFVIMIGRETMEEQLVHRAKALARGECPTTLEMG